MKAGRPYRPAQVTDVSHRNEIVGTAPGKVILLGEHAVVYGRVAIAAAIDRHVTVTLRSASGPARFEPEDDSRLAAALARAIELVDGPERDFVAGVSSTLPRAMGLGSSAALSVALIRALAAQAGRPLAVAEVSALAFEIETIFHGTPSGIDNSAAAYGGLISFRRDDAGAHVRALAAPRSLPLVIALGREPRSTSTTVGALRRRRLEDPQRHEQFFDEIGWLVADAEAAVAAGDLTELGLAMNANHGLLHALGVSTDELENMVTLARRGGALGAKLTGGGGGGAVICLCPDERERLIAAFTHAGWQAFSTDIAHHGGRGTDGRDDANGSERRHAAGA